MRRRSVAAIIFAALSLRIAWAQQWCDYRVITHSDGTWEIQWIPCRPSVQGKPRPNIRRPVKTHIVTMVPARQKFNDCQEAGHFLNDKGFAGEFNYTPTCSMDSRKLEKQSDGSWVGRGTFHFGVINLQMMLPVWSWPNMTSAEKKALRAFIAQLTVHENGHRELINTVLSSSTNQPVEVTGHTSVEAESELDREQSDLCSKFTDKTAELNSRYDFATMHGLAQSDGPKQGLPGGEDVKLVCPE